jgi:S1-C subfamily serine protease
MGELRASCVARVRVKDRTGQLRRVGSGYLITPAAVLTAAHVLAGASAQDVEVMVDVGSPGQRSIPALAVWRDDSGGSDLAVIEVRADSTRASTISWASISARAPARNCSPAGTVNLPGCQNG